MVPRERRRAPCESEQKRGNLPLQRMSRQQQYQQQQQQCPVPVSFAEPGVSVGEGVSALSAIPPALFSHELLPFLSSQDTLNLCRVNRYWDECCVQSPSLHVPSSSALSRFTARLPLARRFIFRPPVTYYRHSPAPCSFSPSTSPTPALRPVSRAIATTSLQIGGTHELLTTTEKPPSDTSPSHQTTKASTSTSTAALLPLPAPALPALYATLGSFVRLEVLSVCAPLPPSLIEKIIEQNARSLRDVRVVLSLRRDPATAGISANNSATTAPPHTVSRTTATTSKAVGKGVVLHLPGLPLPMLERLTVTNHDMPGATAAYGGSQSQSASSSSGAVVVMHSGLSCVKLTHLQIGGVDRTQHHHYHQGLDEGGASSGSQLLKAGAARSALCPPRLITVNFQQVHFRSLQVVHLEAVLDLTVVFSWLADPANAATLKDISLASPNLCAAHPHSHLNHHPQHHHPQPLPAFPSVAFPALHSLRLRQLPHPHSVHFDRYAAFRFVGPHRCFHRRPKQQLQQRQQCEQPCLSLPSLSELQLDLNDAAGTLNVGGLVGAMRRQQLRVCRLSRLPMAVEGVHQLLSQHHLTLTDVTLGCDILSPSPHPSPALPSLPFPSLRTLRWIARCQVPPFLLMAPGFTCDDLQELEMLEQSEPIPQTAMAYRLFRHTSGDTLEVHMGWVRRLHASLRHLSLTQEGGEGDFDWPLWLIRGLRPSTLRGLESLVLAVPHFPSPILTHLALASSTAPTTDISTPFPTSHTPPESQEDHDQCRLQRLHIVCGSDGSGPSVAVASALSPGKGAPLGASMAAWVGRVAAQQLVKKCPSLTQVGLYYVTVHDEDAPMPLPPSPPLPTPSPSPSPVAPAVPTHQQPPPHARRVFSSASRTRHTPNLLLPDPVRLPPAINAASGRPPYIRTRPAESTTGSVAYPPAPAGAGVGLCEGGGAGGGGGAGAGLPALVKSLDCAFGRRGLRLEASSGVYIWNQRDKEGGAATAS